MVGRRRRLDNGLLPLTDRQQRFVDEYIVDLSIAGAARRAGYSETTRHAAGSLLGLPHIAAAVEAAMADRAERTRVDADKVIAELAKIAFANMLDFVTIDPDGSPRIDFRRLSREDGAAIQTMTIDYGREVFAHRRKKSPDLFSGLPAQPSEALAKAGAKAPDPESALLLP